MKIILATSALALLLFVAAAAGRSGSGVRGKVLIEPAYPVCRVDQPCTRPAGNTRLLFTRARLVRSTRTAEDGTYRISLAPGTYTVTAPGASRMRKLDPARVVVPRAGYRRVTFKLDIGIQ